jgi:murein DD-endopeptidase MepM/ murein hydrolase activator NlpD
MRKSDFIILLGLLLPMLVSCSTIPSGHYVLVTRKDNVRSLSKEYKVSKTDILAANEDTQIRSGKWVFIPKKRSSIKKGSLAELTRGPASIPNYQATNFVWPVPSKKRISSTFGRRGWTFRKHEGIDIPAKRGSKIVAANDGIVIYSGRAIGGYGNVTVLAHPHGYFTLYAHAKKNFTKKGQRVKKGQTIALVGSTGRSSGPHLHFEIRHDDEALDPEDYL